MIKYCIGCKGKKPLSEFYFRETLISRCSNYCKNCEKKRVHEHYQKNCEKMRIKDKERYQKRKHNKKEMNRKVEYQKNHRTSEAVKAYNMVKKKLVRPDRCEKCGKECKPHAHHDDYSKPLEVLWLCAVCHRGVHNYVYLDNQLKGGK